MKIEITTRVSIQRDELEGIFRNYLIAKNISFAVNAEMDLPERVEIVLVNSLDTFNMSSVKRKQLERTVPPTNLKSTCDASNKVTCKMTDEELFAQ